MCIFTEELIKLIVETDKASRLDVEKALKRRESITAELNRKKEQIDALYKKEADDKITKARIIAEKEAENFKEDLTLREKRKADKLKAQYEENHTKWESDILKNIISE